MLPYKKTPLDLYRAHFWHAEFNHDYRTPFASVYTSLGCKFKCDFCMINIVNRTDNSDGVVSANSPNMRFWSPQFMVNEFEKLAKMGVKTIRISDEMFFLNTNYYEPLLDGIIERQLDLRMWTYSRVDTVRPQYLEKFRKAGINWLALGVEAGNQTVRREVSKGSFQDVNIREVIKTVRSSGMYVISNYIFGFPEDTYETMQQTLDLALELNTEMANMYPCQALPGSPLYYTAKQNGWKLPSTLGGYAFLSYDSEPLPTKHLTAAQVLKFNLATGAAADLNFRKAVQQAINAEEMLGVAYPDISRMDQSWVYAGSVYHTNRKPTRPDLGAAKASLAKSGYKGEKLVFIVDSLRENVDVATVFQAQMAQIGVNVDLKVSDWPTASSSGLKRDTGWNFWTHGFGIEPYEGPVSAM